MSDKLQTLVANEMAKNKVSFNQAWTNVKATPEGKEAANAGTSEGVRKSWETRDRHGNAWHIQKGVTMKTSKGGHNVTAIGHTGSPVTTQVWDGGHQAAAQKALQLHAAGEASKASGGGFDEPIAHVFIHSHEHKETHHFDMNAPSHVKALKSMAGGK